MDLAPLESHSEAASQKLAERRRPGFVSSLATASASNLDSCAHPRWLTFTRAAHGSALETIPNRTKNKRRKKREVRATQQKEERRHRGDTDSRREKEVAGMSGEVSVTKPLPSLMFAIRATVSPPLDRGQ
jgi:hypothetical protein